MSRKQIKSKAKTALNVVFFVFMTMSLLLFLSGCEEVGLRLIIEQKVADAIAESGTGGDPAIRVTDWNAVDVTTYSYFEFDHQFTWDPDQHKTFTITNTGESDLNIGDIMVSDAASPPINFSLHTDPSPVAIKPNDTAQFVIEFVSGGEIDYVYGSVMIEIDDPLNLSFSFDVRGYADC